MGGLHSVICNKMAKRVWEFARFSSNQNPDVDELNGRQKVLGLQ